MKKRSLWDLVDDETTGRLQAAKVWLHIGNAVATKIMLGIPAAFMTVEMLGAYLGIVTLGYGGMYWLTGKRRSDESSSSVAETEAGMGEAGRDRGFLAGGGGADPSPVRPGGTGAKRKGAKGGG